MRVYADAFFALNAVVDGVLLWGAGRLGGARARPYRLAVAGGLGGVYALAALLVRVPIAFGWPGRVMAAVVLCAVAYGISPWRRLLHVVLLFFAVAAFAAGAALALGSAGASPGIPWWTVGLALGLVLWVASVLWQRWAPGPRGWSCHLDIEVGGRTVQCQALVDSGNGLRAAGSGRPAIIVTARALRELLPPELVGLGSQEQGWSALTELAATAGGIWSDRLRLFPFSSVGQRSGLLCGFEPDATWVDDGHGRRSVRAAVAVTDQALSPDGLFEALVPVRLLEALGGTPWRPDPVLQRE